MKTAQAAYFQLIKFNVLLAAAVIFISMPAAADRYLGSISGVVEETFTGTSVGRWAPERGEFSIRFRVTQSDGRNQEYTAVMVSPVAGLVYRSNQVFFTYKDDETVAYPKICDRCYLYYQVDENYEIHRMVSNLIKVQVEQAYGYVQLPNAKYSNVGCAPKANASDMTCQSNFSFDITEDSDFRPPAGAVK